MAPVCMAGRLLLPLWLAFLLFVILGTVQIESLLVYDHQSILDLRHNVRDLSIFDHGGQKTLPPLLSEILTHLYRASALPPRQKRLRRRGKRGGRLVKLKVCLARSSSISRSGHGLSFPFAVPRRFLDPIDACLVPVAGLVEGFRPRRPCSPRFSQRGVNLQNLKTLLRAPRSAETQAPAPARIGLRPGSVLEFYDVPDSFLDPYSQDRENTTPAPQSDYVPPPGDVTVLSVSADQETVSLGFSLTETSVRYKLQIDYSSIQRSSLIREDSSTVTVGGLNPGTEYTFSIIRIADNGNQSKATSLSVFTEPSPPAKITVDQISSESLSLSWDPPAGEVESYTVTCCSEGETEQVMTTDANNLTFSNLKPGVCYSLQVSAQLRNGRQSKPAVTAATTKTHLQSFLKDLGLEQHYTEKLSLNTILQIDERTISDESIKCNSDLPWYFLKKLMMVNVTARNMKCTSACESYCDDPSGNTELDLNDQFNSQRSDDMLNPLDIITALFLCSDAFVQQEMAHKMSMCQFSVPLLLPNCDTKQCTLMLWAMRDIVKKYRPQSLSESKGFIEQRIVLSELPMISFVRLGECSLSKSEILNKLLSNSQQYFKQTEGHVYLVEGYREDFANSAKTLRREMESSVFNQLTATADIRQGMTELDKIKENHAKELEGRVCALIEQCRGKNVEMTGKELDKEFDKMWNRMVKELSFSKQKPADVFARVYHYLRENLRRKGSHVCQLLSEKSLTECGLVPFKYTAEGFFNQLKHRITKFFNTEDHIKTVQQMADSIIADCKQYVTGKVERKSNYHDTYIQEILHMIDEKLQNNKEVKTETEFEVSLKQHICGDAARQFQKMHSDFIHENDPYRCLNENKAKFLTDFKDVFHKRDQCQKKAEEFTNCCLKPAVEDFVKRSLGPDIIGEMMTSPQFSTRIYLQYTILLDLLTKDDFKSYLSYIGSYEDYVKKWILDQIVERFSKGSIMFELEDKHVQSSIRNITNAINKAKTKKIGNLKTFVEDVCQELGDKLVISQDALGAFMILNNADPEQFANWLTDCLKDMAEALRKKFKETNIQMKLRKLNVNPQNELFTKLIGCGKQCPFCKAPCEAGEKTHTEHWTSLHRPDGLGAYRWSGTNKLAIDICSSSVLTDICFRCNATNGQSHPYKRYKEIFPDWKIVPEASLQASDYWKYVLERFNDKFAKEYHAKPADIPASWKGITRKQAEASIKESFNIK
ncbi:LOW QUALITY PROTEIN: uncharacterized protein LOC126404683 [Epinephelus moara]|uniref:LOW QUALITY PROTEIN: uncharacterized protein LOC126404683 n=1 Tax=Epinephelus moara TaxID=300413 RepID=UPI00214EF22A|nr:LOW QUALITY PROTEIN: uncharacterized protein LOC126404683 [Epinephelus moara]